MRTIVVPDVHVPFHDRRAWALALGVIEHVEPDQVVVLGDFADFLALSMHAAEFGVKKNLKKELKGVRAAWSELVSAAGDAEITFLVGNHETRLLRYVAEKAPVLEELVPSFQALFGMKDDVEVVPYWRPKKIGKVRFVHDLGFSGRRATQQALDATGHCVAHGHDHRATLVFGGNVEEKRIFAMGCGWLGDRALISYMPPARTKDWQQGLGLIDFDGDLAFPTFLPFVRGRCVVDGEVVSL